MRVINTFLFLLLLGISQVQARDVVTHVIDVGAGLCTVTAVNDEHFFVYDTGPHRSNTCYHAVKKTVKFNDIDLMVVSHNDADHYGGTSKILTNYSVDTFIWTGFARWENESWLTTIKSIADAKTRDEDMRIIDLSSSRIKPGKKFKLGEATIEFVYGLSNWKEQGYEIKPAEHELNKGELRNVISIVMRLSYRGKSILFTGDTVGRDLDAPASQCAYAESIMVNDTPKLLNADVLIAAHHGADNGSATCFVDKVKPQHVIFSAGSKDSWGHPRTSVVGRILSVNPNVLFYRTDLGDDETHPNHYEPPGAFISGCNDKSKDDNLNITISDAGQVAVAYLNNQPNKC